MAKKEYGVQKKAVTGQSFRAEENVTNLILVRYMNMSMNSGVLRTPPIPRGTGSAQYTALHTYSGEEVPVSCVDYPDTEKPPTKRRIGSVGVQVPQSSV